jgi:hypothetical protein
MLSFCASLLTTTMLFLYCHLWWPIYFVALSYIDQRNCGFWDVTPWSLTHMYQRFGSTYCLLLFCTTQHTLTLLSWSCSGSFP